MQHDFVSTISKKDCKKAPVLMATEAMPESKALGKGFSGFF
jgi:hypothetical protein